MHASAISGQIRSLKCQPSPSPNPQGEMTSYDVGVTSTFRHLKIYNLQ